jgi:predicted RNase H-like HicB family nuclease
MTQTYTTVITQEGKWFVARCIELGVASQGRNVAQAETNLKEAMGLYSEAL